MHDRLTDREYLATASIKDTAFREAKSAHDRINRGLTTVEEECARLGRSWQQVLAQQAAERKAMQALGLNHPDLASWIRYPRLRVFPSLNGTLPVKRL